MEFSYSELLSQRKKIIEELPTIEKYMVESLYNEIVNFLKKNGFSFEETKKGLLITTKTININIEVYFDKVLFITNFVDPKKTNDIGYTDVKNIKNDFEQIVTEKRKRLQQPINPKFLFTKIIWLPEKETLDNFIKTKLYFIN